LSKDLAWKFSGNVGLARKFLMTNFLAPEDVPIPPSAADLMFPLGLAGNDLIPLDPTARAEKFCRRSADDMTSLRQ
jgi:hypothetical protein